MQEKGKGCSNSSEREEELGLSPKMWTSENVFESLSFKSCKISFSPLISMASSKHWGKTTIIN